MSPTHEHFKHKNSDKCLEIHLNNVLRCGNRSVNRIIDSGPVELLENDAHLSNIIIRRQLFLTYKKFEAYELYWCKIMGFLCLQADCCTFWFHL